MKTYRRLVALSPAVLMAFSSVATSQGQVVNSRSSLLEEVIVTAQKREQSSQDVAIAVSAFSGDTLKQLGVEDTTDISAMVPGFTFADSGYSIPTYTIRGIGFADISQAGSSTVGVYVDEIILPYPAMTKGANLDLERVEVLKGPQGTLYGRNTTGGAVNYITRKPTETFEAGFSADYGKYNRSEIDLHASGPVAENLGGRVALKHISQGDWQYDYTRSGGKNGEQDKIAARSILEWNPSETFRLRVNIDGWQDKSDPQMPQAYVFLDQSAIAGFAPSTAFKNHPLSPNHDARATAIDEGKRFYLDEKFWNAAMRAEWDISDTTTLMLLYSKQRYNNNNRLNLDGMYVEQFEYIVDTDLPSETIELRANGIAFDDRMTWVVGYFHAEDRVREYREFFLTDNSTGDGGRIGVFDRIDLEGIQKSSVNAIFGQVEYQASEDWRYTAGLRYNREERDNFNCSRDVNGDTAIVFNALELAKKAGVSELIGAGLTNDQADLVVSLLQDNVIDLVGTSVVPELVDILTQAGGDMPGFLLSGPQRGDCFTLDDETGDSGPTIAKLDEDNISGKLAVDWTPTVNWADDLLIYASYTVGYKSGSFPLVPSSNSQQAEPVTQERVNAYEIGSKMFMSDYGLRLNGALFYYKYLDKQLFAFYRDQIFGTLQRLDNVPESEIAGAELEIQYSPSAAVFTSLSISALHSEVKRYHGINANGDDVDFSGNEINYTPPLEAAWMINYDRPLPRAYTASFGLNVTYSAKAEAELSNDPRFARDEYAVFGARMALRSPDERWSLALWGKNITDEVYYTSLQRLSDIGVRYAGMPRTYGISFTYDYF